MIGAITNGVDSKREPHLRGFAPVFEEFLAIHIEDTLVIFLADIRLEHRGGMRAERAVHEYLNGANPQPVIPEACTQTKLKCLLEQFHRDILEYTQFEF